MAISGSAVILSRLKNVRNIIRNVSNHTNISSRINQNLFLTTRTYTVDINSIIDTSEDEPKPKKKMSKAMKAYLERAREHDQFMKREITEYQIGKRHLANMMGENPETFTQNDVNVSIRYLFPSGLYDKYAKPIMETPEKVFPPRKAAQFDESGRPHHPLFYTCKLNYYQILYDIVENMEQLNDIENKALKNGVLPRQDAKINLVGSDWLTKKALEEKTLEVLTDEEYDKFIAAVDRLAEHPHAFQMKDFIMGLRTMRVLATESLIIPKLEYTPEGRPYITVKDSKRKTARATVTVFGNGTGKITINGKDIRYFHNIQSREQLVFPLIFSGMQDQVDVEATVKHGGFTGQAGAIRFGIAWALRSFVDINTIEKMRIAGLLTRDVRRKERKKPGQEGARRKFTWKKR